MRQLYHRRKRAVLQRLHELGMSGRDACHFEDAIGRLSADDTAFAGDQVVLQCAVAIPTPSLREASKNPVEDHGEEVVDERRVPFLEQLTLEQAIVPGNLVGARFTQPYPRLQRAVEAFAEASQSPLVHEMTRHKSEHGLRDPKRV